MVRKVLASDWHILAGILDGMFVLSCMRNLSLGYVLTNLHGHS